MAEETKEPIKTVTTVETNLNYIVYFIEKVGVPVAMIGLLAYIIFVKFEKLEYQISRCIRNERAIMQKLEIPIIVKDDAWEK